MSAFVLRFGEVNFNTSESLNCDLGRQTDPLCFIEEDAPIIGQSNLPRPSKTYVDGV